MGSPEAENTSDGFAFPRAVALEQAAKFARGIVFIVDHSTDRVQFLNRRAETILGLTTDEIEPLALVRSWVLAEDLPSLDALPDLFEIVGVGETIETQLRLRHRGGGIARVRGIHVLLSKSSAGTAAQSLVTLEDVSEAHLVFEALERRTHELETTLAALPDAFFRIDRDRIVTRCSAGRWRPGQWDATRAVGRAIDDVLPPESLAKVRETIEQVQSTRREASVECVHPERPDSSLEAHVLTFFNDELIVLVRDLSDRARGERELTEQRARSVQSAKLAALGEMAAGVAHEINTPLAVICAGMEFLKEELDQATLDRTALAEEIDIVHATSLRIAETVRSLRAFTTDEQRLPAAATPVNAFLSDALSLCRQRVESRGVPVEAPDVPPDLRVLTRRSEAAQIMLNLVGNAFDAVAALAERWIKIEVASGADRVTISVTDSGMGVPEEHRGGLFRLFFTTKPVGKGTGLGLAVSRQLAESHGGALELDPTSEHTRFVLTLTKA